MFSFQLGYGAHFRLCVRLPSDRKSRCLTRQKRGGWYSGCWFSLFLSLGVRTTPDHKFGRAHLKNVASCGAKLKFWKIEFLQLFHSKSGALYVKTPHKSAAFSVSHLSSTHFGAADQIRTGDLILTKVIFPFCKEMCLHFSLQNARSTRSIASCHFFSLHNIWYL